MSQSPRPDSPRHSAIDLHAAFSVAWRACGWSPAMPRAHEVLAVLCDLSAWRPWGRVAQALIDVPEHARSARLRDAVDREERALAYALHRLLLGAWLGEAPTQVP